MARPGGYAIITDPALGHPQEMDTFTCAHCQKITFLHTPDGRRSVDQGGFCRPCFKPVCGQCADLGRCTPFESKLERRERESAEGRRLLELLAR
jgi:hypothetical protein